MLVTRIAAALTLALTVDVATQSPAASDSVLDQDDVAIIRAVVDSTILPEIRAAKFGRQPIVLLIDRTLKLCDPEERRLQPERCLSDPRGLPRQRKTETSFEIPDLGLPSVQLVAPDVVQRAFQSRQAEPADGWQQLGRLFPGFRGFARVSSPAYVDDGAVIHASFGCGLLCGKSWLVRLARNQGQWRVVDRKLLTVS
jgi:hypothetical protein